MSDARDEEREPDLEVEDLELLEGTDDVVGGIDGSIVEDRAAAAGDQPKPTAASPQEMRGYRCW